ncbi:hypothetical protein VPH35_091576 [Triticum aestivum]
MAISKLIALFFAFAAVAATLPPFEARVQAFTTTTANKEEADPSSKAAAQVGSTPGLSLFVASDPRPFAVVLRLPIPATTSDPGLPPLFGPLPGTPGAPPAQRLPGFLHVPPSTGSAAAPSTPPPAECLTPLMQMAPCVDYLTNITVVTPPATCRDGLKSQALPHAIDPIRMIILPLRCGAMLPLRTLLTCSAQPLPPLAPPSATLGPPTSPVSSAPASSPVSTPTLGYYSSPNV